MCCALSCCNTLIRLFDVSFHTHESMAHECVAHCLAAIHSYVYLMCLFTHMNLWHMNVLHTVLLQYTHKCIWRVCSHTWIYCTWMYCTLLQIPLEILHPSFPPNRETQIPRNKFKFDQNVDLVCTARYRGIRISRFWRRSGMSRLQWNLPLSCCSHAAICGLSWGPDHIEMCIEWQWLYKSVSDTIANYLAAVMGRFAAYPEVQIQGFKALINMGKGNEVWVPVRVCVCVCIYVWVCVHVYQMYTTIYICMDR